MSSHTSNMESLGFSLEDEREIGLELTPEEEIEYIKSAKLAQDESQTQEINASQQEVHDMAKNSLDFLAALAMPTVFQFLLPPVFKIVWNWLLGYIHKERDFSKLVLGLPRGFGKSTLMKIFILFCILFTKRKFILIIGATASLAENIIADVIDMLEEPNIKAVFGDWKLGIDKDTQGLKKFGFRGRNIIIAGIGVGGSLRGLNLKNERPDVMLFDDAQTRECADSETEATKLEQWIVGTAMKAKSPLGCLYIFVGNMYPTKFSILRKLKHNAEWVKFICGGILQDGTSLWEELQPIRQLLEEYKSDCAMGHPEIFFSEVLNDENASVNNLIDVSKIPPYPYQTNDIPIGNFIVIDPSNDKHNSDAVTIMYFEIFADAKPVCMKLVEDRLSPGETIVKAVTIALEKNCRLIAIESNAYQYSLLYWFNFICTQRGIIGINPVEIYSGSLSKNTRILTMFKSLLAGEIIIAEDCKAPVFSQVTGFNPLKKNNTDGILDCLTYAPKVVELYGEFLCSIDILTEQETNSIPVLEHNSCF